MIWAEESSQLLNLLIEFRVCKFSSHSLIHSFSRKSVDELEAKYFARQGTQDNAWMFALSFLEIQIGDEGC
jgi:hypothetical protein